MPHTLTMQPCPRPAPHTAHTWRETVGRRRTLQCPGAQGGPPDATIRLRADAFTPDAMEGYGWPSARQAAQAVGVSPSTLRRAIAGQIAPGERLIAALLVGTGRSFEGLFQLHVNGKLHDPLPM